jgi:hypothetical protein
MPSEDKKATALKPEKKSTIARLLDCSIARLLDCSIARLLD